MSTVDFTAWVIPPLVLTLGDQAYTVQPPSVERAKMIFAAAARAEVNLGLTPGPLPAELDEILDAIGTSHPALGDKVFEQMAADEVPVETIDRLSYYATFYWARGADYAGALAQLLWGIRDLGSGAAEAGEGEAPKA
ncbi:DUF7426 family protein [Microbacterium dauci]|uniref:DUF7426 domain-containing protein n=1 Tax=Microbacterium dauci TaxID=3048008 RepID=A0ABT6ZAQ6_9MICO|nr:hypothetical protein [Microbacterium sp. LX3-4]MDJ1113238.1 hypothetical protein [Microbacterium sp. LX3-4]